MVMVIYTLLYVKAFIHSQYRQFQHWTMVTPNNCRMYFEVINYYRVLVDILRVSIVKPKLICIFPIFSGIAMHAYYIPLSFK